MDEISPKTQMCVVLVRRAEPGDAAGVTELLGALGYPATAAQMGERIAKCSTAERSAVFVAISSGRMVGCASFHAIPVFHAAGFLGRITSLVVAASHRRMGVGRELLSAVEQFAREHDCVRIEVTSGDHRPEAHVFYQRLGYAQDIRRFLKCLKTK